MPLNITTQQDMFAVITDRTANPGTDQWRSLAFPRVFQSTSEEIGFHKIDSHRKIAPFMYPHRAGRPIFREDGEQTETFKPAYTKPKDAVTPSDSIHMSPGEISGRIAQMSPEMRQQRRVVEILTYHRESIEKLWDYMAARSLIDGKLDITYADGETVTVDFNRSAAHDVTLTGGDRWGQAGISAWDDLQSWIDIVGEAARGGNVTDVLMGSTAAAAFLADQDVKDRLDRDTRGADQVVVNREMLIPNVNNPFQLIGFLGSGINVWRVSGPANTFPNPDGTTETILNPKDVLLLSPNVQGVQAFGAILDVDALVPTQIWPKAWTEHDPSARFIMTQSAPLMIPTNPDATLRATVT